MADIKIHREHSLGLKKAREIAWAWAEQLEDKYEMKCTVVEGKSSDTVEFTRPGVKGELDVTASHFEARVTLGFLFGAFKGAVEAGIKKELDTLLAAEAGKAAGKSAEKAAVKPAGKK